MIFGNTGIKRKKEKLLSLSEPFPTFYCLKYKYSFIKGIHKTFLSVCFLGRCLKSRVFIVKTPVNKKSRKKNNFVVN